MTDVEVVELAIRRVLDHIRIQPHETGIETVLRMLADELAKKKDTTYPYGNFVHGVS